MKTTVLSAIYDAYDQLKPPFEQDVETRWILVTDNPCLKSLEWEIIYQPSHLHPNRAAKHPKMFPWLYTDTETSVWLDASFRVVSPCFVREALAIANPIAQFVHPWRDCVYTESVESALLSKYRGEPVLAQTDCYREAGHPAGWGLWATGVIARQHTPAIEQMGYDWMEQIECWSYQDQLSQPFVLRNNSLRPDALTGDHLTNPWLIYEGSARH